VKVPVELLKLHKEVFLTANIFFVNKIPFSWHWVARFASLWSTILQTELSRRYSKHSGDISVLPPLWLSRHNGACGWGICTQLLFFLLLKWNILLYWV
jgi:hypothetical protein